ncbi:MAG TPA: alternative ribosome rescue aminoacyl-tRNA hydrolase ArfB [Nevskiaceae bacterium]|nr:alternative ribosome rescue aminoacyl-tRNA hydrolase ArfB [Nevskiaceae bacterium]
MPRIPLLHYEELEIVAVLASGPGGQNVNKTASAAQLRYNLQNATLPSAVRTRLLARHDRRIDSAGVITIQARQFRSFERNRAAAIDRLEALIDEAAHPPAPRHPTRVSRGVKRRRLDAKTRRGRTKGLRRRDPRDDP